MGLDPLEVVLPRLQELTVRIVSATGGAPLPQAYVRVQRGIPEHFDVTWRSRGWTTDADGEATFLVYPGSKVTVEAAVDGYVGRQVPLDISEAPEEAKEIELEPAATLAGTVFEPDGSPAADLRLSLLGDRRVGTFSAPKGARKTDSAGRFELEGGRKAVARGDLPCLVLKTRQAALVKIVSGTSDLHTLESSSAEIQSHPFVDEPDEEG